LRTTNLIITFGVSSALMLTCASMSAAPSNALLDTHRAGAKLVISAVADETFKHEAGGIQFNLPDGWNAKPDGEVLTVSAPDDTITMVFWVTEADDFEAATEALDAELAKQIKNLKFDGEPKEGKHNEMPHVSVSGSGQIEGQGIAFSADLLMAKKPVIILTFASPENFEKHGSSYMKLVRSIKKIG
jgi:hypothetical protein